MTEHKVISKAMELIHRQSDKLDEYEKQLNERWDNYDEPIGEPNSYGYKYEAFMIYLSDNAMIKDLIENLPDGVVPSQITLKNIRIGVKPKSQYGKLYSDAMGLTRDEIEPRSASLKKKDKDYKNFVREHKAFYLE